MKNYFEFLLFIIFSKFFSLLGLDRSRKFAGYMASFFFNYLPIRKQVVIDNLKKAFPEYSAEKINEVAYKCYYSFSLTLVEILLLPSLSDAQMLSLLRLKNPELFHLKYQENKGIVLLSAHFANWEIGAMMLSVLVSTPFYIAAKQQRNILVDNWLNKMRTRYSNVIVPLGVSIRNLVVTLKEKKVAALVADQRGPKDGPRIKFMGIETASFAGPAALAIKTGATMLYAIAVRREDLNYDIEFVEISKENLPDKYEDKVIELTQRHYNYLENIVRKYPDQWFWMHKRWKY